MGNRLHTVLTHSALAIATICFAPTKTRAELDGERFTSETWRISIEGPKGWQLTEAVPYPSSLLWMVRQRPHARMLFSAEEVSKSVNSERYAKQTATQLEELGFTLRTPQLHGATGAYWIDFDDGAHFLRQAVLVIDGTGYSLTLATSHPRTRVQLLRAFDFSLRSIRPDREKEETDES